MGSTPDVFDWASVVLSNNYMKMMPHEDRNELLHSMLEPYEITIIADRDKIILDGPWGNILKSKVKLSAYFLETNNQPLTIESIMESTTLADVIYEEILTDDALEITSEEILAETLSVYETAMLLKHHTPIDVGLQTSEQKTNVVPTVALEEVVEHNVNPPAHGSLTKKTKARYKNKDLTREQCGNNTTSFLSDGEKELYITIALSSHTDDFQTVIEKLGRPATLNLDEITDEIIYSNESSKSLPSEDESLNNILCSEKKKTRVVAICQNGDISKRTTSHHKTPKKEKGYRITRKDHIVDETFKVNDQMLGPFKFYCGQCSLKTNQRSYYLNHIKLHEKNGELLSCSRCNYKTTSQSSLGQHKKQHATLKLSCDLCNYQTNKAKCLENHTIRNHKGKETMYECTRCDYTTATWYQIKLHVQEHVLTEDNTFRCQQCPYTSLLKMGISRHIRSVHLNLRPYLCHTCGKRFKRQDGLKAHAYLHDPSELRFPCPICARVYVTPTYLASHMVSHSKERPFLCDICGAGFKMLGTQRQHVATVHSNPGRFSCNDCGRKFNRRFTLIRHMKTHWPQVRNRQLLPIPVLSELITTKRSRADATASFQGDAIVLPDSSQVIFDSQATMTVVEGHLDGETMSMLTEVEEAYDVSQSETATALLYLTNN